MPRDQEADVAVLVQPAAGHPAGQHQARAAPVEPDLLQVFAGPGLAFDPGQPVLEPGHRASVKEVDIVDEGVGAEPVFPPRFPDVKFDGRVGRVMATTAVGLARRRGRRLEVRVDVTGQGYLKTEY